MKKEIIKLLEQLETEHNIKILFAVENGSRAWDMESKDSDYDVRFVFYRTLPEYITLMPKPEVINAAYDKDLNPSPVQGSLMDMSGFDIFKYLKLLKSSNPTVLEWLNSPIVYLGSTDIFLKPYMAENFSQEKLFYHYFSLFKSSYKTMLSDEQKMTYKKYLYAMRGLLNAQYVYWYDELPPLRLLETLKKLENKIPAEVSSMLRQVIKLKTCGQEKEKIPNIIVFDNYFTHALQQVYDNFHKRQADIKVFDAFLHKLLLPQKQKQRPGLLF